MFGAFGWPVVASILLLFILFEIFIPSKFTFQLARFHDHNTYDPSLNAITQWNCIRSKFLRKCLK